MNGKTPVFSVVTIAVIVMICGCTGVVEMSATPTPTITPTIQAECPYPTFTAISTPMPTPASIPTTGLSEPLTPTQSPSEAPTISPTIVPVASPTISPTPTPVPTPVITPGPSDYLWNFGDNTPNIAGGSPTHTYENNGTYEIRLWHDGWCYVRNGVYVIENGTVLKVNFDGEMIWLTVLSGRIGNCR